MSHVPSRHQTLFIVRLWSEATQPNPTQWRGSVEHIPSGQRIFFTSLTDMLDFIIFSLSNTAGIPAGQFSGLDDLHASHNEECG